ncbi:MAG: hypothetical protein L3V56_10900 [Candidatus Magnetoovum sp. WYHC-5]|nr:hypothetical protein [Candidatus Magnetoovum sp. WYHC-5]
MAESGRERDLVLAPNEYAFILDETKGNVIAYVGPFKTSLANTDRPVVYEEKTRRFRRCTLEESITQYPFAEEGWYIVVENPAKEGDEEHPKAGPNSLTKLISGRKVNIPGPITFPLWPGQVAHVIQGHHLRSNQYLVVQVYNEEAAKANWEKAVIKPQKTPYSEDALKVEQEQPATTMIPDLTIGKLLIIKGNEIAFYIPPTGIEVLRDTNGNYVREAVTLERLEYCILLDEDGNKRFITGPAVVFPNPTEVFIEKANLRKFKAIELNEISGIYIKVIAPYKDEQGRECKVGEELFITGKEQMIYFPRPEHAIIKYVEQEKHYAIAIPAGEARYVLNRLTGDIFLKKGPCMFLPDPRNEVIVRRVLDINTVQLLFPGNQEAVRYNKELMAFIKASKGDFMDDRERLLSDRAVFSRDVDIDDEEIDFVGDSFKRGTKFTPPRTITLDTKYEGAVAIDIWAGYAVLAVRKTGDRKVLVGPKTLLLEYDETLKPIELSTGTPKKDSEVMKTVYLKVLNNRVSDAINAETKDLCPVAIRLSYRINFEGNPNKWFDVENYVKFLTEHMRSLLKNTIKQKSIEDFYINATLIIRDTILGVEDETGKRMGTLFEENGMRIYDVEVLNVIIQDSTISSLLIQSQHTAIHQAIQISEGRKKYAVTKEDEQIKQKISELQTETVVKQIILQMQEVLKTFELTQTKIKSEADTEIIRLDNALTQQEKLVLINEVELERDKAKKLQLLDFSQRLLQQQIMELSAEVKAVVDKANAISPDLIAALQAFADKNLAEKMAQTMAPLAIIGGKSVADVLSQLLKGTPLEKVLEAKK